MAETNYMKKHLSIVTEIDGEVIGTVAVDGVSQVRWFQGKDICQKCKRNRLNGHETKPGYEHGDERWCETCYYAMPIGKPEASVVNLKGTP